MSGTPDTTKMPFDYSTINPSTNYEHNSRKAPVFNGDASTFEWWKDRIYSHIT
ncbi:hypothetical protein A2U01_0093906, partial [Trifolium medium]|nr:hypothetical protein [Trifolium medium]